ncbi:DUF2059 domain-containing protein [Undibacterium sp. Ji83W]|uniref:DUF2059 domain-containing protein n=1 Tax=Undibacterium sp. Ji83W TaxID=3413043 RepID=UPI003BF3C348
MKKLALFLALVLQAQFSLAAAPSTATMERFLNAYQFEPIREQWVFYIEREAKSQITKLRTMPDLNESGKIAVDKYENAVMQELESSLSASSLRQRYANIFSKVFTESEMLEITKFYESEVGKTSVKKRSQIGALIKEEMTSLSESIKRDLSKAQAELETSLRNAKKK